jgi:hypothetical protein
MQSLPMMPDRFVRRPERKGLTIPVSGFLSILFVKEATVVMTAKESRSGLQQ